MVCRCQPPRQTSVQGHSDTLLAYFSRLSIGEMQSALSAAPEAIFLHEIVFKTAGRAGSTSLQVSLNRARSTELEAVAGPPTLAPPRGPCAQASGVNQSQGPNPLKDPVKQPSKIPADTALWMKPADPEELTLRPRSYPPSDCGVPPFVGLRVNNMGILGALIGTTLFYFLGIISFFFVITPALAQVNWGTAFVVFMAFGVIIWFIIILSNITPEEMKELDFNKETDRIPTAKKTMYLGPDGTPEQFCMWISKAKHKCHGDLVDNRTLRLRWMRCSIGQARSHGSFTGEPLLCSFESAQKMVVDEFPGWRIPSIEELRTLVYLDNKTPYINPHYFPTTTPSIYFSSTEISGKRKMILGIDFSTGSEVQIPRRRKLGFVRLVRDIPRLNGS